MERGSMRQTCRGRQMQNAVGGCKGEEGMRRGEEPVGSWQTLEGDGRMG